MSRAGPVEHIRIRFWDKVRALELLLAKFAVLDEGRARNALAAAKLRVLPPPKQD